MAFVLAPRLKKTISSNLGGQFATLGANVSAFINILMSMF
jgi:ethanolamine transporter EutH